MRWLIVRLNGDMCSKLQANIGIRACALWTASVSRNPNFKRRFPSKKSRAKVSRSPFVKAVSHPRGCTRQRVKDPQLPSRSGASEELLANDRSAFTAVSESRVIGRS